MSEPEKKPTPLREHVEESGPAGVSPGLDLLVDEHEEEVSENGRTVRRLTLRDPKLRGARRTTRF